MTDDFTPCERTIRMCLDALPKKLSTASQFYPGWDDAIKYSTVAITALLLKPDPAKALLDEWDKVFAESDQKEYYVLGLARWLFETGRMK